MSLQRLAHTRLLPDARKSPYQGWPSRACCQALGKAFARADPLTTAAGARKGSHQGWISCTHSYQFPRRPPHRPDGSLAAVNPPPTNAPVATGAPVTPAVMPPLCPVLNRADPSAAGKPQEQTSVGNPHAEVRLKSQLRPRGGVTKEEEEKSFHAVA